MKRLLVSILIMCMPLSVVWATANPIDEQEFVDFLATVATNPSTDGQRASVDSLINVVRSDGHSLDNVLDWAVKYLLDSRSPLYMPQLYDSLFVMDRVGRKAMDFDYADTLGNVHSLYSSNLADTTVLFFYAADCDHCVATLRKWSLEPSSMPEVLRTGRVLAVCLNDDNELWRSSLRLLPKNWTPVRDLDGLIARRRYDLRQLPHTVIIDSLLMVLPVK